MIAILLQRSRNEIKKVKLRFRKHIMGFASGLEGTKAYFELLKLQKQEKSVDGKKNDYSVDFM
jgi:hypothetical protein